MHSPRQLEQLALRLRSRFYASPPPEGERPAAPREWFKLDAADDDVATVLIYGDIGGWWGVDAGRLVQELHGLKVGTINVHINSYGGAMFDGFAIYSTLRQHPAHVVTWVDGVAASAASLIAIAGDECVMEPPARLMIHDAGTYASGNCRDLREAADLVDEFSTSVADLYADRGTLTAQAFREAMIAETWYSAEGALDVGLCDRVNGTKEPAPTNRASQLIRARHAALMTLGGVKQ